MHKVVALCILSIASMMACANDTGRQKRLEWFHEASCDSCFEDYTQMEPVSTLVTDSYGNYSVKIEWQLVDGRRKTSRFDTTTCQTYKRLKRKTDSTDYSR